MKQQQNNYHLPIAPNQELPTYKIQVLNLATSIPFQDQLNTLQNILKPYENHLLKIAFEKRDPTTTTNQAQKIYILTTSKKIALELSENCKLPEHLYLKKFTQKIQNQLYVQKNQDFQFLSSLKLVFGVNNNTEKKLENFYHELTYELFNYDQDSNCYFHQKPTTQQQEIFSTYIKKYLTELLLLNDWYMVDFILDRIFIQKFLKKKFNRSHQKCLEYLADLTKQKEIGQECEKIQSCPNQNYSCRFYGSSDELQTHLKSQCKFRKYTCKICKKIVLNLTQQKHNEFCGYNKKPSSYATIDEYQDKMLIIQNFPKNRNLFDVKKFLELFGPIQNFSFKSEEKTKVLNFFCKFERQDDAIYSKSQLHGINLHGSTLQIEYHKSKEELQRSRVYIKGLDLDNEHRIRNYVEKKYGKIKLFKMLQKQEGKKGICYVEFSFLKDAQYLIKEVQQESNCVLGQCIRYCAYSLEYIEKLNERKSFNNNTNKKKLKNHNYLQDEKKSTYQQNQQQFQSQVQRNLNGERVPQTNTQQQSNSHSQYKIYPNLVQNNKSKFKNFILSTSHKNNGKKNTNPTIYNNNNKKKQLKLNSKNYDINNETISTEDLQFIQSSKNTPEKPIKTSTTQIVQSPPQQSIQKNLQKQFQGDHDQEAQISSIEHCSNNKSSNENLSSYSAHNVEQQQNLVDNSYSQCQQSSDQASASVAEEVVEVQQQEKQILKENNNCNNTSSDGDSTDIENNNNNKILVVL